MFGILSNGLFKIGDGLLSILWVPFVEMEFPLQEIGIGIKAFCLFFYQVVLNFKVTKLLT